MQHFHDCSMTPDFQTIEQKLFETIVMLVLLLKEKKKQQIIFPNTILLNIRFFFLL